MKSVVLAMEKVQDQEPQQKLVQFAMVQGK